MSEGRARHRAPVPTRPETSFDHGLQHERTALAWERTAVAVMVAGMILARTAAVREKWLFAAVGLVETVVGAGLLVWAGVHYDDLHGPLRRGDDVVHPSATRLVGLVAVVGSTVGLAYAVVITVRG